MKRMLSGFLAIVIWIHLLSAAVLAEPAGQTVNINVPTADKNWFSNYKPSYTPASTRPELAPPVVGIRSISSSTGYDYKQSVSSLRAQADKLYINSFKELFASGDQRYLNNLVAIASDRAASSTTTGNKALDSYQAQPYPGLSENEVKWLINNNIVSRDPNYLEIIDKVEYEIDAETGEEVINPSTEEKVAVIDPYGNPLLKTVISFERAADDEIYDNKQIVDSMGMDPLFTTGKSETMKKSDFLMALHKGTYGILESRPLVFDIIPYRYAQKLTWTLDKDTYIRNIGDPVYQPVFQAPIIASSNAAETERLERQKEAEHLGDEFTEKKVDDRGEFITRLEGDTNYIVATFPDKDKMIVTSPNVVELYIKSLIDKGILSTGNLIGTTAYKENSKNALSNAEELAKEFVGYGQIEDTKRQKYPAYAPELGPLDTDGKNHTFFEVDLIGNAEAWGRRYTIDMQAGTIELNKDGVTGETVDFFIDESMTTMDALKFIEAIMRVREGDMTDTEAKIVSYKYGVTFIDTLHGSDRSTVMYLTAKGILNFENFAEYTFLYEKLEKVFAYTLLYRVANPAARKNMREIQLTDTDSFWMGKGFGSYNKIIRLPDTSAVQSYKGYNGGLVTNSNTELKGREQNSLQLVPFVETRSVTSADNQVLLERSVQRSNEILAAGLQGKMTKELSAEYFELSGTIEDLRNSDSLDSASVDVTLLDNGIPVYHAPGLDIYENLEEDLYENIEFLTAEEDAAMTFATFVSGISPFGSNERIAVSDTKSRYFDILKLFDDIYKYLFDGKPIMANAIPATIEEKKTTSVRVEKDSIQENALRTSTVEGAVTKTGEDGKEYLEITLNQKNDLIDLTPLLHKDCSALIISVKYDCKYDRYDVTFRAEAMQAMAALQLVDSKLEMTANQLTNSHNVQVVAKYSEKGEEIILVPQSALVVLDPDLVVLNQKTLLNRRTGAKAFILTEQNLAIIGNNIVSAPDGSIMIDATDNETYYNLEIISALLSNSALSEIGSKDFYNNVDIQTEELRKVISPRGDEVSAALIGNYPRLVDINAGNTQEIYADYINLSQLTMGSNLIMKDFTRSVPNTKNSEGETVEDGGFTVDFTVVVEWNLILPGSGEIESYLSGMEIDPSKNPAISEVNKFYYTRPSGVGTKELQDYWDSNISISNAIANVMFETTGYNYINCGYLVPEVSLLFEVDSGGSDKLNQMVTDSMQSIIGAWLQEVGQQIDKTWINKFLGSYSIYNRIIKTGSGKEDMEDPDHFVNFKDDIILVMKDGEVLTVEEWLQLPEAERTSPDYYRIKANNVQQEVKTSVSTTVPFNIVNGNPQIQLRDGTSIEITIESDNSARIANKSDLPDSIQALLTAGPAVTLLIDETAILIGQDLQLKAVTVEDNGTMTEKTEIVTRTVTTGEQEWLGGVYFNEKALTFNWFPVWFHAAFNNPHPDMDVIGGGNIPHTPEGVTMKNGMLWRRLDYSRIFNYYARKERRSFGTVYGTSGLEDVTWVKLPSGAVYKSIGAESGYTLSGDNIVAETRGYSLNKLENISEYSNYVGKIVNYSVDGVITKYYVSRFDQQYLELISLDAISGSCINGEFIIDGSPLQETAYAALVNRFAGSDILTDSQGKRNSIDSYKVLSNTLRDSLYESGKVYLITGANGEFQAQSRTFESVGGVVVPVVKTLSPAEYSSIPIYYNPVIRLSVFSWDVSHKIDPVTGDKSYFLGYRKVIPAMLFSGLYQSSMTRTMVDTLVSRSVGYIPLEEVPVGSTILVGDTILYKDYIGYVTSPIKAKYTSDLPAVNNGNSVQDTDVVSSALRIFNIALDSNGSVETVADYVKSVTLAPKSAASAFTYSNTMIAKNLDNLNTVYMANGVSVTPYSNSNPATSVSYLLDFSEGLKVLPLSSNEKSYSLLFSTSASGVALLTQLPVFGSDVNFYVTGRVQLEAFSSDFKPLPNQAELKMEFKSEVAQQTAKDVKYWIQMVLSYLLAYLMVITTIMFFAVRNTTFSLVVDKIKHPANGQRGPDLVQIMTIGIMSNDQEVTGGRLFVSLVLLGIIFAILTLI